LVFFFKEDINIISKTGDWRLATGPTVQALLVEIMMSMTDKKYDSGRRNMDDAIYVRSENRIEHRCESNQEYVGCQRLLPPMILFVLSLLWN
jgi:hypothetical protein